MAETVGCWWEANRADDVAAALARIRTELDASFHADITNIINEILHAGSMLRDLSDLLRIYRSRICLVKDFLLILLPCFGRTIDDMRHHLGEKGASYKQVWNTITVKTSAEGSGSLYTRFIMYNGFMVQLVRLLSRPSMYDTAVLKSLIDKTLRLRAARGIEAPRPLPILPLSSQVRIVQAGRVHWAQQIFDRKHTVTRMRHQFVSCCYAPSMPDAALEIPPSSTVLFKLKFNQNLLSVVMYLHPDVMDAARILCRWTDRDGSPSYASRGLHELRIKRKGCSLKLERWSAEKQKPEPWMVLYFKTWEKMVLFHDVFAVLKQLCPLTIMCDPEELVLGEEKKLFRGRIVDDEYDHVLTLYQDKTCGAIRFSTTIWNGPFKRSPIWTAFIQPDAIKLSFVKRVSRRVLIRKLDLNVYSSEYSAVRQMTAGGHFVLSFCDEDDAEDFMKAWKLLAKEVGL